MDSHLFLCSDGKTHFVSWEMWEKQCVWVESSFLWSVICVTEIFLDFPKSSYLVWSTLQVMDVHNQFEVSIWAPFCPFLGVHLANFFWTTGSAQHCCLCNRETAHSRLLSRCIITSYIGFLSSFCQLLFVQWPFGSWLWGIKRAIKRYLIFFF